MATMRIVQRRDVIRGVRERWVKQYEDCPGSMRLFDGTTVGAIRERLEKLDLDTCSGDDIDAAIGTTGWAKNECGECGESFDTVIRFGPEPDYESNPWDVCLGCLEKSRDLLGGKA